MKNKHKIILVKTVIVIAGIFNIPAIILLIPSDAGMFGEINEVINKLGYILLAIGFFFTFIMLILMFKIDILPEKSKPKKYKMKENNFKSNKMSIITKILEDNYCNIQKYKSNLYEIEFAIKNKNRKQYIIAVMELEELSEEIYKIYKKNSFEDFGNYLIDNGLINPKFDIYITYIICVHKKTKVFTKYTEKNVCQYYQRYNLPVGIDLENSVIYIATQNDGMAKLKYNKLKHMFIKYMSDIIETDEHKSMKRN